MLVLEWLNNLDKITFKSDTYINLPQRCAPLYYTDLLQLKLFSIGIFECRDPVGLVILVLNWMMWFYTNVSVNFGKVYPLWKKKVYDDTFQDTSSTNIFSCSRAT